MIAPGVPLEDISEVHLTALIEQELAERRTVEYKRKLPQGGDEDRREFLADVSSFANAGGGDLIFGIDAIDGVPKTICPLSIQPDSERLRWEQAIRDGIDPRIAGVRLQEIPVNGGHALLIRVPRSWAGPHLVKFKNWSRFFSRTSAGKYQLDVHELRSAFLASGALVNQIREFRDRRSALISANEGPVRLHEDAARIIVHLVPFNAFSEPRPEINLEAFEGSGLFTPLFARYGQTRWNIDGRLAFHSSSSGESGAYSQLFRNGIFEGVDTASLGDDDRAVYGEYFEYNLNQNLANPLEVLKRVGVEPPIAILVTVTGMRDRFVHPHPQSRRMLFPSDYPIDRDVLVLPDVVIDEFGDYEQGLPRALRPIIDAFWQAGGYSKSPHYDTEGDWTGTA